MNKTKKKAPIGLGLSRDYFSQNLIPSLPELILRTYYGASVPSHYNGIEILFFLEGNGTTLINNQTYPVNCEDMIILSFSHILKIVPANGEYLKLYRLKIAWNTFLFLLANPCCHEYTTGFNDYATFLTFPKPEQNEFHCLFDELKHELSYKSSSFHIDNSIFLVLEILAKIDRNVSSGLCSY